MTLTITDHQMTSDLTDVTATRHDGGLWKVTGRDGFHDHNAAITAMAIAEFLADGYNPDDPLVQALEAELADRRQP